MRQNGANQAGAKQIQKPASHSGYHMEQNLLLGLALGAAAYIFVPMGDGFAKILSQQGYDSTQITWGRYFVHMLLMIPLVLVKYGPSGFIPKGLRGQTLRSLTIIAATLCFFTALHKVPLADALTLAFVAPLVVTGLSLPVLGERVGIHRWLAVIIGFIGAMIVIKPGSGIFQWEALFALGAGTLFGVYITITRKLAGQNPPLVSLVYQGFLGVVVLGYFAYDNWQTPTLEAILFMSAVGLFAAVGHGMIIAASNYMEAGLIAPLQYLELVVGAIFGYIVFGDIPDRYTWIGSIIIISSGLYIAYREHKNK